MLPLKETLVLVADSYAKFIELMKTAPNDANVLIINGEAISREVFFTAICEADGIGTDQDGSIWPGSGWAHARANWQLPEDAKLERQEAVAYFANEYHAQEAQVKFALDPVVRMARFGLKRQMIHQAAIEWPVRDGVHELFSHFSSEKIAIISYGLYDVIRAWCMESLGYCATALPAIYALRMLWDQEDRLIGPDTTTVITDNMKTSVLMLHATQLGTKARKLITIGDSPSDEFIQHGIGIAVVPPEKYLDASEGSLREDHRLRGLKKMWDMSCAVALGSLMPVAQIRRGLITL